VVVPGVADQLPAESEQERAAHDALNTFTTDGSAYFLEMATRPRTIGYALLADGHRGLRRPGLLGGRTSTGPLRR
jgi:hypothetical protein